MRQEQRKHFDIPEGKSWNKNLQATWKEDEKHTGAGRELAATP